MDEILLHIPHVRTIQLNDIFLKTEESYENKKFIYKIFTGDFFERINELKKYFDIIKKEHYNNKNSIINSKKDKILEYIEYFKKDHKFRVMEKGIYPTFFLFQKNLENENYGICGWWPTNGCCEKNISHYEYEKKINYLHLTDEEKSFLNTRKNKLDYLSPFFKDEFKKDGKYIIPFKHILWYKRNFLKKIRDYCGFVCPKGNACSMHKFLDYVEMLWKAEAFAVEEKNLFYNYFMFENLVYKNNV